MNLNLLRQCRKHLECVSSEWSFCAGTVFGVFCAPLALLFGVLLPPGRAFWLAIGTCGVLLMQLFPAAFVPPHFEQIMAGRSARIDYEIRLDDLRITGVDLLELPQALRAQLTKIRFDGEKCRVQGFLERGKLNLPNGAAHLTCKTEWCICTKMTVAPNESKVVG